MRFHLTSPDRGRSYAKSLHKTLDAVGVKASVGECQAALAEALGYDSWAELKGQAGKHPPSPFDHEVDDRIRRERRDRQAGVLERRFGLERATAAALAERVGLTASRLAAQEFPVAPARTVAEFLAACGASVMPSPDGTCVFASMPLEDGLVHRFELVFGTDGPCPRLAIDVRPLTPREARSRTPVGFGDIRDGRAPLRLCLAAMGFVPGERDARSFLSQAMACSFGRTPLEAEVDEAERHWERLLREAGVRDLDRLVDRDALDMFASASAVPGQMAGDFAAAYDALRLTPSNERLRGLLAAFPLIAYELWGDPAVRTSDGPDTPDALAGHLAVAGLWCGTYGQVGPLPRKLVDSLRDVRGGEGRWTPSGAVATLRLARARGEDVWRWYTGERLDAYVALAEVFDGLQRMWSKGSVLEAVGKERLVRLLDGPPWRVTDVCKAALDQPDLDRLPGEAALVLARAAVHLSGESFDDRPPRLDPSRHGPHLLGLLDAGDLGQALGKAMLAIARASLLANPARAYGVHDDVLRDDMGYAMTQLAMSEGGVYLLRLRGVGPGSSDGLHGPEWVSATGRLMREASANGHRNWRIFAVDPATVSGDRYAAMRNFVSGMMPDDGVGIFVTASDTPTEEMFPVDLYRGRPVRELEVRER